MLDTNVTLRDLGLFTVFFVIVVAGVFLIRALVHLGGAMRDIKKLISKNAEGLDKVMKDLPAISANTATLTEYASDVTDNLRNEQELIDSALENICDTIESVSDTARAINEDFLGSIKRLAGSIMTLVRFITKKKKPGGAAAEDSGVSGGRSASGGTGGASGGGSASRSGGGRAGDDGAGSSDGSGESRTGRVIFSDSGDIDIKTDRRERRKKKSKMRSAAVGARKRQADRAKSINIHIR